MKGWGYAIFKIGDDIDIRINDGVVRGVLV